jgi:Fur family ferric uptake transcriptional regulator
MSCTKTLVEKGLKLTPQRRVIVDVLHEAEAYLTAEEIITYAQSRMAGIHRATVYRTLEILEEAGCVYRSRLSNRSVYYHAGERHHHHLVCSRCGKTIECDEEILAPVRKLVAEKYGFSVDFQHEVMNGLCERCKDLPG